MFLVFSKICNDILKLRRDVILKPTCTYCKILEAYYVIIVENFVKAGLRCLPRMGAPTLPFIY
jgi:hypothetical protein